MVQIIAGEKGKGKTRYLIDRANTDIMTAEGSVVYLDKSTKHMYELNNRIRLINVQDFPINGVDGLIGFISGIISQDRDLQIMYIDSFLRLAGLESEGADITPALAAVSTISERYGVNLIISISLPGEAIPELFRNQIAVSL